MSERVGRRRRRAACTASMHKRPPSRPGKGSRLNRPMAIESEIASMSPRRALQTLVARPHCQASRDHPPSSPPCRQIFGGHLVTLQPPQPDRPSPRRGRARGERQAFTTTFTLHFLEPAPKKDVRDRHRLHALHPPSAPHRHDRDRGHYQEDPVCHALAHRGTQALARTTASLAIWWRGRRLAELTARRPGRDGVDCPLRRPS